MRQRLAAVFVLALALVATPAAGADSATYVDPPGDSGAAPDITAVDVSDDATGSITFRITFANRQRLAGTQGQLFVDIDSDQNAATGHGGAEFAAAFGGASLQNGLYRWTGTAWERTTTLVTVIDGGGRVEFTFPRTAPGGTAPFDFLVQAVEGDAADPHAPADNAPEGDIWFTFPQQAEVTKLLIPNAGLEPRAGKVYSVRGIKLGLNNGETVAPEKLTCRLSYAHKTLKPLAGGCRWKLAMTLKRKTLTLIISVAYRGQSASVTRAVRVR